MMAVKAQSPLHTSQRHALVRCPVWRMCVKLPPTIAPTLPRQFHLQWVERGNADEAPAPSELAWPQMRCKVHGQSGIERISRNPPSSGHIV
jgi:hypothetical protein